MKNFLIGLLLLWSVSVLAQTAMRTDGSTPATNVWLKGQTRVQSMVVSNLDGNISGGTNLQFTGLSPSARTSVTNAAIDAANSAAATKASTNSPLLYSAVLLNGRTTNLSQYVINVSDGTGVYVQPLGSGMVWRSVPSGGTLALLGPSIWSFVTNVSFSQTATFYGQIIASQPPIFSAYNLSNASYKLATNWASAAEGSVMTLTGDKFKLQPSGAAATADLINTNEDRGVSLNNPENYFAGKFDGTLLDNDGQDAVQITLTKVIVTPSHALVGDISGGSNAFSVVSGDFLGQAIFTNMAQLIASPLTNRSARVLSYWGTNGFGGGDFHWQSGTGLTTNRGIVFNSAYGGQWVRDYSPTNVIKLEWFGVRPMDSDSPSTTHSEQAAIDDCLALALANGRLSSCEVEWPPFWVGGRIVLSNACGVTIKGSTPAYGAALYYPNRVSGIGYIGPTNGTVIQLWNCQNCKIVGMGIDADTPMQIAAITNHAQYGVQFDQTSPYNQICTANTLQDCTFQTRQTNCLFTAFANSLTSANNCENMKIIGNLFNGGGSQLLAVSRKNFGAAIMLGNSANSRAHVIRDNSWSGFDNGLICSNGGFSFSGGLGNSVHTDFAIHSWAAPVMISDFFTEQCRRYFQIGSAAGGSGGTIAVEISNYHNTGSTAGPFGDTNTPLIDVYGSSANLYVHDSVFYASSNQIIYKVANGASAHLRSYGNVYGAGNLGFADLHNFGLMQFLAGESVMDLPAINASLRLSWGGQGSALSPGYKYQIGEPSGGGTNRTLFATYASALRMVPEKQFFQIGNIASALTADDFVFGSFGNGFSAYWGDALVANRERLDAQAGGSTYIDFHSTNNSTAALRLFEDSTSTSVPRVTLQTSGSANTILDVRPSGQFDIKVNQAAFITMSSSGGVAINTNLSQIGTSLTVSVTNATINATNVNLNADVRASSNVFIKATSSLALSNMTPNRVAMANPASQATNVVTTGPLLGTGLPAAWSDISGLFTDPGANTILVWDDTDNVLVSATIGSGITYNHGTHTLTAAGGGGSVTFNPNQFGAGSGGTNILDGALLTNIVVTGTLNVNGTIQGTSMNVSNALTVGTLLLATNSGRTDLIDMSLRDQSIATNNGWTYSGVIHSASWPTNTEKVQIGITNTAGPGSPITVTFPASIRPLPGGSGNTITVTNFTLVSVGAWNQGGTNRMAVGN